MPAGVELCSHDEILSYDEIVMVCREAVKLGIVNFKITGGEPLVRKDCAALIKQIYDIDGANQVTLTTNGILLEEQLDELVNAGLRSVNISLDTVNRQKYKEITGFDQLDKVIEAIKLAVDRGLRVKVNSVLHDKDYYDDFLGLIEIAKYYPVDVRFIEMMPIGLGADSYLVSNDILLGQIKELYDGVECDVTPKGNGPAIYYKIDGFKGAIGFISAIHGKFCDTCNRIRLTSTGEVKACLCYDRNVELWDIIKKADVEKIYEVLNDVILDKPEKHCFEETENITENKRMTQIGG